MTKRIAAASQSTLASSFPHQLRCVCGHAVTLWPLPREEMVGEAMVKRRLQFNTLPGLVARPNIVVEKLLPPTPFLLSIIHHRQQRSVQP